jgi:hypothetical protein
MHVNGVVAVSGGVDYVWRGDPSTYDFTQASLILDSTLRILDLSAIVPSDAKLVHIRCRSLNNTATGVVGFTHKDNLGTYALPLLRIQVANIYNERDFFIPIGTDGLIKYYAVAGIDNIDILILGWFK